MPKRIVLPSSDALFADNAPRPGAEGGVAPPRPVPRGRTAAGGAPPARARSSGRRPGAALAARLDRIEGGLDRLPVDTLIELRDSLDELLGTGPLSAAAVERLLAGTGL